MEQNKIQESALKIIHDLSSELTLCEKENLTSVILFGSAADNNLRVKSDVNILLILKQFHFNKNQLFLNTLRKYQAAINIKYLILQESEIKHAKTAFACKFFDIKNRHKVIYGKDAINDLSIEKTDLKLSLMQNLLNLSMKLRSQMIFLNSRTEKCIDTIAEVSGPIRSFSSTLRFLTLGEITHPKKSLELFVQDNSFENGTIYLQAISDIRLGLKSDQLPPLEIIYFIESVIEKMILSQQEIKG